jgi:cyclin L
VAKLSSYPKSPRSIINVFAYVASFGTVFLHVDDLDKNEPESYYVSEGTYYDQKMRLVETESTILRVVGFETHVVLPYVQCINFLQTLDVFGDPKGKELALRAHSHLNSSLFNPQLLYITHQPSALATAAIYLAAREVGVKLPGEQWWEVFDTDREVLGFLVVALQSMEGYVEAEKKKWANKKLPFTVDILEYEITVHNKTNGIS